jgi:hypothetical protein
MSPRSAPRIALALLLLAALACGPSINIPVIGTVQAVASQVGTLAADATQASTLEAQAATALATVSGVNAAAEATFAAATPIPTAVVPADQLLPAQVQSKALKLSSLVVNSNGTDFFGPILSVQLTNPSTHDVVTTIPCGLIFTPDDNTQQRLMVLQPISATIGPGGAVTLKPFVDCIDDSKHAPANTATYQLGTMSSGDLLKLAACICTQPISGTTDINQMLGVQVAVWHTSDPQFPGQVTSSLIGPALKPLMPLFLASANAWLTKCGLKIIPAS